MLSLEFYWLEVTVIKFSVFDLCLTKQFSHYRRCEEPQCGAPNLEDGARLRQFQTSSPSSSSSSPPVSGSPLSELQPEQPELGRDDLDGDAAHGAHRPAPPAPSPPAADESQLRRQLGQEEAWVYVGFCLRAWTLIKEKRNLHLPLGDLLISTSSTQWINRTVLKT